MANESPTPRTDAVLSRMNKLTELLSERSFDRIAITEQGLQGLICHARQLEIELADKDHQLTEAQTTAMEMGGQKQILNRMINHSEKQLAEARAEIESATINEAERWADRLNWLHTKYGADCSGTDSADLLDCVEDEIKQVINKQSELIEQMREALNVLVASATPSGPLWHGSAEMQIARAALSAAERGE